MKFTEYPPTSRLAPFIRCYWSLQDFSVVTGGHRSQFLTEAGMELVFNFGDSFSVIGSRTASQSHDGAFVIGPMTRAQWGHAEGRCHLFGVCFQPGAASSVLPGPFCELADHSLDIEDLWGGDGRQLAERLQNDFGNVQERIGFLNRFFDRQFMSTGPDLALLSSSFRLIRRSRGQIPIETLAERMGVNRRRLERLFIKMVGISPKRVTRLFRIKHAIRRLADPCVVDRAGLAVSAGYFDQAHFNREFKAFTGLTPSSFKSSQSGLERFETSRPPGNSN